MKTYFMAVEIRNDQDKVVRRLNATFETGLLAAIEAFETMASSIARKQGCSRSDIFVTTFNSV